MQQRGEGNDEEHYIVNEVPDTTASGLLAVSEIATNRTLLT